MLKYTIIPFIIWGCFSEATAVTRDQAARRFEQTMNGLNISNNDYSQFNNQMNMLDPDNGYNQGNNYNQPDAQAFDNSNMGMDNSNQAQFDNGSNFPDQGNYNVPPPQDDLAQKVKDLEDDMGDMMRRIGKIERELKNVQEKYAAEKKKNSSKTTKKAKKK